MKNILIVNSTPRKGGNSEELCRQFLKGATEAGHKAELVSLREKKIGYCTGCGYCSEHGKKEGCSQKDDMADLAQKALAADVIVLATPVYFYTMCAQLKTFIDRMSAYYTSLTNKEFYYILSAADGDTGMLHRTLESLRGFTEDCLEGAVEKGIVYGVGVWGKGEVQNTAAYREAYEQGKNA